MHLVISIYIPLLLFYQIFTLLLIHDLCFGNIIDLFTATLIIRLCL